MSEINTVISSVVDSLSEYGIAAAAYPEGLKKHYAQPVTAVGIKQASAVSAGHGDYMGLRLDNGGQCREIYGRKLMLTLSLTVYSPKDGGYGAKGCTDVFGKIAAAVGSFPEGIKVKQLRCGEVKFDTAVDMFRLQAEADITAFLYAEARDDGEYLDFTVRGELET